MGIRQAGVSEILFRFPKASFSKRSSRPWRTNYASCTIGRTHGMKWWRCCTRICSLTGEESCLIA